MRFFFTLLLPLAILMGGTLAAQDGHGLAKDDKRELKKLLRKAEGHLRFNEYDKALAFLQEAETLAPRDGEVNLQLGKIYLFQQQPFTAIPHLEIAHQKARIESPDLMLDFARAAFTAEKFALADKLYTQAGEMAITETQRERASLGGLQLARAQEMLRQQLPVVVMPLPPPINTKYNEIGPVLTHDRQQLFFTTQRPDNVGGTDGEGVYYEDVYAATLNPKNKLYVDPKPLEGSLNTTKHDACISIAPDGRKMLVFQQRGNGDIYTSRLRDSLWRGTVAIEGINSRHRETSATLSPDGTMMVFTSDRPGGQGGMDLWLAIKNEKGEWGNIENLGPGINTPYDEEAPFWHASNKTLYFSSKGHNSIGGFDIFVADRQTATSWGNVRSLGVPVNSTADDNFFYLEPAARFGYFASKRIGGLGGYDLYKVDLRPPEEIATTERKQDRPNRRPDQNLQNSIQLVDLKRISDDAAQLRVLSGTVSDGLSQAPLGASIFVTNNATGQLIDSTQSDPNTGAYLLSLPAGKDYGISVQQDDYLAYSSNIVLPDSVDYEELTQDIALMPLQAGSESDLQNIFFEVGSAKLKGSSETEIGYLKRLLEQYKSLTLAIIGHTDNTGGQQLNMRLSEQRAQAVVDALVAAGIRAERLQAKGMGPNQPIATNDTEQGRAQNRRVSFKVIATE